MATKTCFQPPHGCSATNPDSASASGTCHETALAALAQTSNTPTPCCPIAPIPSGNPGDGGPDNDDNNNPDDDDPSNSPSDDGPGDDNLDENDPEDELDFPDPDTKPMVVVFNSLMKAIKLLACNTCTSPESPSRTKLCKPNTFDGTDPKKLHAFFIHLPDRIKDEEIDACYWECKEEVHRPSKHQGSSNSSNNKSRGSGNNNQAKTGQEKAKTGSNNNSGSSPKPASSKLGNNSNSSKPEPSKLSKDGKLTPEECKCRIEGNLCMFCRGPGHFTEKCPKKARKTKAHTVATTEAAPTLGSGSTPKTKK
ncbi:hypothetical protein M404DRAFT_33721 [Pisolithus tinctorius Marx 270]|uniref:CCHC-type domain-containing protein n=1 Tax=Pisolithus tinctorius Marx 270 TaxID=870435 RepID=A0A0C3IG40_PISTI|nr:hypothetical protein M404DRAFT_33721 [Pisolithus tinctorius Marx 270]